MILLIPILVCFLLQVFFCSSVSEKEVCVCVSWCVCELLIVLHVIYGL